MATGATGNYWSLEHSYQCYHLLVALACSYQTKNVFLICLDAFSTLTLFRFGTCHLRPYPTVIKDKTSGVSAGALESAHDADPIHDEERVPPRPPQPAPHVREAVGSDEEENGGERLLLLVTAFFHLSSSRLLFIPNTHAKLPRRPEGHLQAPGDNADARTQRRATIYVVVRIPTRDIAAYRAGNPAAETILDGLQVKVGHTKSLARRQRAYRKCDRGGLQTHLWLWYYKADKRCLAERLLHRNFPDGGAQRIQTLCLGVGCGVRHREFWPLMEIGGLGRLDETAVCVLTCLGQRNPTRILIPLPIHLADIYSVILDAP
ncbi:hypothetical protein B0H12DRAFT_1079441 [Mycena haematopus]|nr:hypothetical protein B0H12DRAFT_1079441 [Mycena haematopus]